MWTLVLCGCECFGPKITCVLYPHSAPPLLLAVQWFDTPPFLGTRFFPVSGQNHEKRVKNGAERPRNGRKDVERRRTAVPRRSKL